jgi:hypothetical protein
VDAIVERRIDPDSKLDIDPVCGMTCIERRPASTTWLSRSLSASTSSVRPTA